MAAEKDFLRAFLVTLGTGGEAVVGGLERGVGVGEVRGVEGEEEEGERARLPDPGAEEGEERRLEVLARFRTPALLVGGVRGSGGTLLVAEGGKERG